MGETRYEDTLRSLAGYALWLLRAVSLLLLCAALFFGNAVLIQRHIMGETPPMFGDYTYAIVQSGSMEPEFWKNDVIIVKRKPFYNRREIVLFISDGHFVTHRIVKVTPQGYVTRGDSNTMPDKGTLYPRNVVGKVIWIQRQIGDTVVFFRSPYGVLSLAFAALFLFLFPGSREERALRRAVGARLAALLARLEKMKKKAPARL